MALVAMVPFGTWFKASITSPDEQFVGLDRVPSLGVCVEMSAAAGEVKGAPGIAQITGADNARQRIYFIFDPPFSRPV